MFKNVDFREKMDMLSFPNRVKIIFKVSKSGHLTYSPNGIIQLYQVFKHVWYSAKWTVWGMYQNSAGWSILILKLFWLYKHDNYINTNNFGLWTRYVVMEECENFRCQGMLGMPTVGYMHT